jgi:hypothetical protein
MLSLRFIVPSPRVLLISQHFHVILLTTQGPSSNTTDAFSPNPVLHDASLGNTLAHNVYVEKMINQNLEVHSV